MLRSVEPAGSLVIPMHHGEVLRECPLWLGLHQCNAVLDVKAWDKNLTQSRKGAESQRNHSFHSCLCTYAPLRRCAMLGPVGSQCDEKQFFQIFEASCDFITSVGSGQPA